MATFLLIGFMVVSWAFYIENRTLKNMLSVKDAQIELLEKSNKEFAVMLSEYDPALKEYLERAKNESKF